MLLKSFHKTLLLSSSLLVLSSLGGIVQAVQLNNTLEIRANTGAARVAPSKARGKYNPKAIVADNGSGKVLKSKKGHNDPKKGVIEYPLDNGGRVIK